MISSLTGLPKPTEILIKDVKPNSYNFSLKIKAIDILIKLQSTSTTVFEVLVGDSSGTAIVSTTQELEKDHWYLFQHCNVCMRNGFIRIVGQECGLIEPSDPVVDSIIANTNISLVEYEYFFE